MRDDSWECMDDLERESRRLEYEAGVWEAWDVEPEAVRAAITRCIEYDPDDLYKPGLDTHMNNLREGNTER